MRRRIGIAIILLAGLTLSSNAFARDLASIPWAKFEKASEVVVFARMIKAEELAGFKLRYTFKVIETYKGKAPETVVFTRQRRESIYPLVNSQGFLFLKKSKGGWALSFDERSFWRVKGVSGPKFYSIWTILVPDTLVRDIPKSLKVQKAVKIRLPNGFHHSMTASFYMRDSIKAFLKQKLGKKP